MHGRIPPSFMESSGTASITLRALVTARWVVLGLAFSAGILGPFIDGVDVWIVQRPPPAAFFTVLAGWATINVATTWFIIRPGRATLFLAGVHLLIDATALTVLLGMAGGATNPFTILYFLPITLATQVSPRWTWTLAGYCLACFATLFIAAPIPQAHDNPHASHFIGHLEGMWVAFGVCGALVTYFVHRIALSLARQRRELAELRNAAIQDRHLAALGTLAAGAAHELGTPLGTINVLSAELPHMETAERNEAIATIRRELARCKSIVQHMASPELSVSTLGPDEHRVGWSLAELEREIAELPRDVHVEVTVGPAASEQQCTQPREVLGQILRELVTNASAACRSRPGSRGIAVALDVHDKKCVITVTDDGIGMDRDTATAAFDPFFSMRTGGLGLGLYLARAHLRQLGGDIRLQSRPGETVVTAQFPLDAPSTRSEAVR